MIVIQVVLICIMGLYTIFYLKTTSDDVPILKIFLLGALGPVWLFLECLEVFLSLFGIYFTTVLAIKKLVTDKDEK